MAEIVFSLLVGAGIGVLVYIMLYPSDNNKEQLLNMPPEGYTTDYLLKTNDLKNGVSKAEIKRRERTGYYWIKCDHNGCITDKKNWGNPKY